MDTWIRYFYVILNVLFIMVGLVLVAFGVYLLFGSHTHEMLAHVSGNLVLIYGMMSVGGMIFLIGACGALGSCYENRCLLLTYLTINVIFLLAQLGVVIFVIIEKDDMKSHLSNVWLELNNDTKYLLQDRFNCCGYQNQDEWGGEFPPSCLNDTETDSRTPWSDTCYDSIIGYFDENIILAGAIAGLVFLLEAFQMVVTCFLVREISNERSYGHSARLTSRNADATAGFDSMESVGASFDDYIKNNGFHETRQ